MAVKDKNLADNDTNQLLKNRLDKLNNLKADGKDPFLITKYDVSVHSSDIKENEDKYLDKNVSVAGRLMFKRVMGKASFGNIRDLKGDIQIYVTRDALGDENYAIFKKSDLGDIFGVKGYVFKTKTGEITIHATEVTLLTKSLQILPEKFHGLQDTDIRYRQRYLDLAMNLDVRETFIKRSKIISSIRKFLSEREFMEVETPILVENAGGASARPFETHFNALSQDMKLRISIELYLKRLIVGGLEKVYEIGRVFRNEGIDTRHNPEFTLMELYQAYTDYEGMMELTESMFRYIAEQVLGTTKISYNGIEIDFGKPFRKLSMYDAVKDMKLRISIELYLKRLIVGGLEKVYEIGRVFRNEGIDTRHNPEFTLMELYQAYTDYEGMMELTESMFRYIAEQVLGTTKISYNGIEIDFGKPFRKLSMYDAVKEEIGIDFDKVETDEEAKKIAKEHNIAFEDRHKKGDIVSMFFDEFCEDKMIQPTFIIDHPIEISPLTKKKKDDPSKVERFELFINGWEMCNAYSELNDPIDQEERFKAQDLLAEQGDEEAQHTDEDFLNALRVGMPPTGGIGYGIDRLVMLLTDSQAIRDVLLFPTMKSLKTGSEGIESSGSEVSENNSVSVDNTYNEKVDFSNVKIEPLFEEEVDFETFSKSDFRAVKVKECEAVLKSKKLLKFVLDDGTGTDRIILSGIHAYYEPEELVGKTLVAIVNLPPRRMMGIDSCGMIISAVNNFKDSEGEELHLLMLNNNIPAGAKLY